LINLQPHYMGQCNASFWIRPRNAELSREINSHSLARLNEKYHLESNSKAEAVRRILYDGGFSYDGVPPAGALQGDPQFTGFYDSSNDAITAYSVMKDYLEKDVKARGYDCTGRRQKSLYLQALAGNKKAKETLEALCHGDFPSHPKEVWQAIERTMHDAYDAYLKQYGCPDRLCGHPMYPAISPPLPNPVKLRGFILRARKARDIGTLSWMLGRAVVPDELSAANAERLVHSVLNRFGYTPAEIAAMKNIVSRQENKPKDSAASPNKGPGGFLLGCFILFASFALVYGALFLIAYIMNNLGMDGSIIGVVLLLAVLGFLVVLCRVFRGRKGRPP